MKTLSMAAAAACALMLFGCKAIEDLQRLSATREYASAVQQLGNEELEPYESLSPRDAAFVETCRTATQRIRERFEQVDTHNVFPEVVTFFDEEAISFLERSLLAEAELADEVIRSGIPSADAQARRQQVLDQIQAEGKELVRKRAELDALVLRKYGVEL